MRLHLKNLQKFALSVSIVIVLNLLFNVAVGVVYNSPDYDNFCREEHRKYYDTEESCNAVGGEWGIYASGPYYPREALAPKLAGDPDESGEPKEYCSPQATCSKEYENARSLYNRNVFMILVSLGVVSIILSIFVLTVTAVSSGFLFGGLFSLFIGTTRYWSDMDEYLRLIVLVITLVALVWVGSRKLKDK